MIGVVTGLEAEARLARRWGVPVAVGGGDAAGAARAAAALAEGVAGISGLVSFGLAGGLDPALAAGALLVPATIRDGDLAEGDLAEGDLAEGDLAWTTDAVLNAALGGATGHVLLGGGRVLASLEAKRRARAAGADAVDLESAAVARVAAARGLGCAALRAVCDPAGRALPPAALAALDKAGRVGALRVAGSVLRAPGQIPALLALGREAAQARRALAARVAATRLD